MMNGEFYEDWATVSGRNRNLFGMAFDSASLYGGRAFAMDGGGGAPWQGEGGKGEGKGGRRRLDHGCASGGCTDPAECTSIPCEGCLDNTCTDASLERVCGPRPGTPGEWYMPYHSTS